MGLTMRAAPRAPRRARATLLRAAAVALFVAASRLGAMSPPARADVPMVKYLGMHPLSPHQGEFCYIDAVHYHRFVPVDLRVYVTVNGGAKGNGQLYVGDPAWLGYDGPKVGYFGPHPLAAPLAPEAGPLFCYIAGAHYHAAAPPPSTAMVLKDGVYWYLGPPPPADVPRSWINEVRSIKGYVPPKVDASSAPPGYRIFDAGAAGAPAVPPKPGAASGPSASAPKGSGAGGAAMVSAAKAKAKAEAKPPVVPRPPKVPAPGLPAAGQAAPAGGAR